MRRRILAAAAILLLVGAVVIGVWWPEWEVPLSCCWRGGAILAAAWLAFDDIQRLPGWILLTLPALVIVLVRWPKLLLLLVPALVAWAALRRFLWPTTPGSRG